MNNLSLETKSTNIYLRVKKHVEDAGYSKEIHWQKSVSFDDLTESTFLKEAAWVILSSGFKEDVLRKKFSYISLCFCDWASARVIYKKRELCRSTALSCFGNKKKIDAIVNLSEIVYRVGFEKMKADIRKSPLEKLKEFQFIGDVTVFHLAKNIGINIAKPDRHLVRIANIIGCEDVQELCGSVSRCTWEPISVIDIVFWRFATITPNYEAILEGWLSDPSMRFVSFKILFQRLAFLIKSNIFLGRQSINE